VNELVCNRPQHSNCKLFGRFVLIDTNFLMNIIEVISKTVDLDHLNRSQLDLFISHLTEFLEKCSTCPSTSKIYTSDQILANEINLNKANSALQRDSPFLRKVAYEYYSDSARFFSDMHSLVCSKIDPVSTRTSDLESVKRISRTAQTLSDEDVSLIVSAIVKSNAGGDAFVVTDDEDLRTALYEVVSAGTISFSSNTFMTNKILPLTSCTYTSYLHKCCQLSNDEQFSILRYISLKDWTRRLSETKRRKKGYHFDEALRFLQDSVRIKAQGGF